MVIAMIFAMVNAVIITNCYKKNAVKVAMGR